jgi:hypothetical protein
MVNLKPASETMLPICRASVPPSLSLEEFLTRRHPIGADQATIVNAGFCGNALCNAVDRGDVEVREDWSFVWVGGATIEPLADEKGADAVSPTPSTTMSDAAGSADDPAIALPAITSAKLPASYAAAKVALSECTAIDECQTWADKAEALASYARQAKDDELRKMADRIQARAVRRWRRAATGNQG